MSIDETPSQSSVWRRFHWAGWLAGAGALFLLVGLLYPAISGAPEDPHRTGTRRHAGQLVMALRQYQTEYASLPTGGNAQILAVLRSDNPNKIVFYECMPNMVSARGELLDPWKMPYRIDTSDPGQPKVYSFGKDKQDNGGAAGSDDIASWR